VSVAADWHEFFAALGQASAVLTGLLFAALSLHPNDLLRGQLFRQRALGALTGLVWTTFAALVLLMPQRWIGVVVAFEAVAPLLLLVGNGRALASGWRERAFHRVRGVLGNTLLGLAAVGGFLLLTPDQEIARVLLAGTLVGAALTECWQGWALVVTATAPNPDPHSDP
jgi:hypothetical protein